MRLGKKDGEKTDAGDLIPATASDTADIAAARVDVQTALATLPDEFRVAVILRDQGELSYGEIAELLEVPVGTVRSRISRGRAELAEKLRAEPNGVSESLNDKASTATTQPPKPQP